MAKVGSSLDERFASGRRALASGDVDLAIQKFVECVAADPASLESLDGLLSAWRTKFGPPMEPSGEARFRPLDAAFAKALEAKRWNDVLLDLPRTLKGDPWQPAPLAAMAFACEAAGADDVAWRWLEGAVACVGFEATLDTLDAWRMIAKAYERLQSPSESLSAWRKVHAACPTDDEASSASARLAVVVARRRGGLEVDLPPPAKMKVEAATAAAEAKAKAENVDLDQVDERGLTPVQRLERLVRDQPGVSEHYLKIVPLYLRLGREYDAEKLLAKAREATGKDPAVVEQWEELVMRRLAKKVAAAEKQRRANPTPESETALEETTLERDRFETDIFLARCKRDPQRTAVRFELGRRLKRAGDIDDAHAHFQAALADAELQAAAAWELGDSARAAGDYPEAAAMFRRAAELARKPEQWDVKRRALCDAGRLAVEAKMARVAKRYAEQVLKADPSDADALALRRDAAALRL